ncbi:hypothetical protein AACH06_17490 [Ideonella sp. DXS29W]|uniref:Uncharacterized protein n=1 Tax=Ideonella lacteola TaxID=2984193 RepID=A0ABU9BRM5_9BURK
MTFNQLSAMKAWMVDHRHGQPVEYHAWDAVLTLWLMGWMGAPAFIVLDNLWAEVACVALFFVPRAYLSLRRRLHTRQRLRCDWLHVVQPSGHAA